MANIADWDGSKPLPPLYSKTATGAVNVWNCWVQGPLVCVSWGQMGGAMQNATFACQPKNVGRANATTAEQQAIKEAISKWKKMLKKKYSETPETAGETVRIKPMLALSFKDHKEKLVYPVTVQPKLDGLRCLAYKKDGHIYLQSRGGDPISLPHIQQELHWHLPDNHVLDGELYIHGASLQSITSLVRRPREESKEIFYCVYDVILPIREPWSQRKRWLYEFFWNKSFNRVWMVGNQSAHNEQQIQEMHDSYADSGYEGAMIRGEFAIYREGYRSPDLLKLKAWEDAEFPIIGWTIGKGKAENMPIFICKTEDGKEFEVVPKGTAEERKEMLDNAQNLLGRLLTVQYLGYTEDGKPKCARGIAIRDRSDL